MRAYISPSKASGSTRVISSKSMLHRLLICAAFCNHATNITCTNDSDDILATIDCLRSLGAHITQTNTGYRIVPVPHNQENVYKYEPLSRNILHAQNSGTTLRFMTAIMAALGTPNMIFADEQLQARPMQELIEELAIAGAEINMDGTYPLHITKPMRAGRFELPGNISSQYVSALLLASPLMEGDCQVTVKKPLESRSYVDLTIEAMQIFGVRVFKENTDDAYIYTIPNSHYETPGEVICEGDWSQASLWLALGALSDDVVGVEGLNMHSVQPDRAVMGALSIMGARVLRKPNEVYVRKDQTRLLNINCSDCPDLTPALAFLAANIEGISKLTGLDRLKFKESNRTEAIAYTLNMFGISCTHDEHSLTIEGGAITAPKSALDPHDDHRICMLQALLATQADEVCAIDNCEVVAKSYPDFFKVMHELGLAVKLEN